VLDGPANMEILHVALELAPFVRTSPAAEATGGLCKAQKLLGHEVSVIVPRRPEYELSGLHPARRLTPLSLSGGGQAHVYEAQLPSGVRLELISIPDLFIPVTSEPLDAARATSISLFAQAVAALYRERAQQGRPPELVHFHDAEAALAVLALAQTAPPELVTLLSVHDARRSGVCPSQLRDVLGIPADLMGAQAFGHGADLCLLKGLLARVSRVLTPSAAYGAALGTPTIHGALARAFQAAEPLGIADGVDLALYNPATDPILAARYDAANPSAKGIDKSDLEFRLELDVAPDRPLVAVLPQAPGDGAFRTVLGALAQLVRMDVRVVFCGPRPEADEDRARLDSFAKEVRFTGDVEGADLRRVLAGADFALCLSASDPAALGIKQAARYGAVPIALAVDGVVDAIVDADPTFETGTGFLFDQLTQRALVGALGRAVSAYRSPAFPSFIKRVMRQDLGWDRPARQVLRLADRLRSSLV